MKNIYINLFIIFLLSISTVFAQNKDFLEINPGTEYELMFIENMDSHVDKDLTGNPVGRVCDFNHKYIYKIPVKSLSSLVLKIKIGNRFKVSLSNDNKNYEVFLEEKEKVASLSNENTFTINASKFLPSDFVFVKFENSYDTGFGSYMKKLTAQGDKTPENLSQTKSLSQYFKVLPDSPSEKLVLIKDQNSVIENDNTNMPKARITDNNSYFIYKINVKNLNQLICQLEIGNRYLISVSKDKIIWKPVIKSENTSGLSNLGWYNVNISEFLPSDFIYIKFEDSQKQGYGCYFKGLTLIGDKSDFTDNNMLPFDLDYNKDTSVVSSSPKDFNYKIIINDENNNTTYYNSIKSNEPLQDKISFTKAGNYTAYIFKNDYLISKKTININSYNIEKLAIDTTAPIYYINETVKFTVNIPKRFNTNKFNIKLFKDKKEIKVRYTKENEKYIISNLSIGKYYLQLDANNESAKKFFEIKKADTKPHIISITQNGYIKVDKQPFAPIILYLAVDLKDAREKGFNTIVNGYDSPDEIGWLEKNKKLLDDANENGMKVILHMCNLIRGSNEDYENIKLIVSTFKNHPGIFGWYIGDEPSANVEVKKIENSYKLIKEIDKNHPVIVLDNSPLLFSEYGKWSDIFISDPYPIPDYSVELVKNWASLTKKASRGSFGICLQGQGMPFFERHPTFEEQKTMLGYALEEGAQSIGWWAHNTLKESNYWDKIGELTSYAKNYILKNFK